MNIHWKDWCWSWNSNTLATWCEELTHFKRPWCRERLKVGGEGDDRGWGYWMASETQGTWAWVSSRSWWWTRRPWCAGGPWSLKESDTTERLRFHFQRDMKESFFSAKMHSINIFLSFRYGLMRNCCLELFSSVQYSCSVVSDSLQPHGQARQASLSIANSQSLLKFMSIE